MVCGKCHKKLPGLRFTRFSATVTIMALVIVAVSPLCVLQYIDNQATTNRLETHINSMDSVIKVKDTTIRDLKGEIAELVDSLQKNQAKRKSFDSCAEIVPNDGPYLYHNRGCSRLKFMAGFRIMNAEAIWSDYHECPYCHESEQRGSTPRFCYGCPDGSDVPCLRPPKMILQIWLFTNTCRNMQNLL